MAANYGANFYDINDTWTPLQIHDFLLAPPKKKVHGFRGNNFVPQPAIQALKDPPGLLSPPNSNSLVFKAKYLSVEPKSSKTTIDRALNYIDSNLCDEDNPAPVVLGVDRELRNKLLTPGHYILQSGRVNDRRFISDPGYQNGILFSQGVDDNLRSNVYQNDFLTWGVVVDPVDLGGMTIAVDGAATMLVTNVLGQQAGYVVGSEEPVQGIPNGAFFFAGIRDLETRGPIKDIVSSFQIPSSGVAPYTVQIIGLDTGNFTLMVDVIGADGSLTSPVELTEAITPEQVKTYVVTPGKGGVTIVPSGPPVIGDIDGDGDVDSDDLNLLLADRNRSVASSTCGIKCDLNNDGRIDALDSRKLVILCTRPLCSKM